MYRIISTTRMWSLDRVFTRLAPIMHDLILALPFVLQNVSKCTFLGVCSMHISPRHWSRNGCIFFLVVYRIISTPRIWSLDRAFTQLVAIMYDLSLALSFRVAQNVSKCIFMGLCIMHTSPSHWSRNWCNFFSLCAFRSLPDRVEVLLLQRKRTCG